MDAAAKCAESTCSAPGTEPYANQHWCKAHAAQVRLAALVADHSEPLAPEIAGWVDPATAVPMVRHPWLYSPIPSTGLINRVFASKRQMIADAHLKRRWETVVWTHERPYRLRALLSVILHGHANDPDELNIIDDNEIPNITTWDAALQHLGIRVWQDAENIAAELALWRQVFDVPEDAFLTDDAPGENTARAWFDSLPDPVPVYRGGISGDWSWTTNRDLAARYAAHGVQRAIEHVNFGVRTALVPKSQVFAAVAGRGEEELLVRCTRDLWPLVHPDRPQAFDDEAGR